MLSTTAIIVPYFIAKGITFILCLFSNFIFSVAERVEAISKSLGYRFIMLSHTQPPTKLKLILSPTVRALIIFLIEVSCNHVNFLIIYTILTEKS